MQYVYLAIAIVTEVAGTAALQASQQFTRLIPSLGVVVGYLLSFYFLSLTLRTMSVGPVYAIWSGMGIVLIALIGWVGFAQRPDAMAALGMALIIAGVLIISLLSESVSH